MCEGWSLLPPFRGGGTVRSRRRRMVGGVRAEGEAVPLGAAMRRAAMARSHPTPRSTVQNAQGAGTLV